MDFYHSPVAVWVNSAPQPKRWGPRAHRGIVVLRRLTSIMCSEFRICLQESYVIILIIFTRMVLIYHWDFRPYEKDEITFCVCLMVKCSHGLAPQYLSIDVTVHVDIRGYDFRGTENMDLFIPRCTGEIHKITILYKGSSLWNKLPLWLKKLRLETIISITSDF